MFLSLFKKSTFGLKYKMIFTNILSCDLHASTIGYLSLIIG